MVEPWSEAAIASRVQALRALEREMRAQWDALASGDAGSEYVAVQAVYRHAVALRTALERWIVSRALRAAQ